MGRMNRTTSIISFAMGSLFVMVDHRFHRYETGLFMAPKVLEVIYGMLFIRGFFGPTANRFS